MKSCRWFATGHEKKKRVWTWDGEFLVKIEFVLYKIYICVTTYYYWRLPTRRCCYVSVNFGPFGERETERVKKKKKMVKVSRWNCCLKFMNKSHPKRRRFCFCLCTFSLLALFLAPFCLFSPFFNCQHVSASLRVRRWFFSKSFAKSPLGLYHF